MLRWAFEHLQAPDGGSVYLRLSTRQIRQPKREMTPELSGAGPGRRLLAAAARAGRRARDRLHRRGGARGAQGAGRRPRGHPRRRPPARDLRRPARRGLAAARARRNAAALLAPLAPDAALVTVLDGHPATLSWLGAVLGHRVKALGVDRFGQSADLVDLYRVHGARRRRHPGCLRRGGAWDADTRVHAAEFAVRLL